MLHVLLGGNAEMEMTFLLQKVTDQETSENLAEYLKKLCIGLTTSTPAEDLENEPRKKAEEMTDNGELSKCI